VRQFQRTIVQRSLKGGALALTMAALVACSAQYRNHGYMPSQDELDQILIGVDTRASIEETLGPPSASGLIENGNYIYVKSRMRSFAYKATQEVEREVLAVSFDSSGTVANIERFGLEDGRVIALERRVTESSVIDRILIRQLLGNFGRIAPPS
jgi:outer membrane protein assembly factor BamE (lipoprotein component of BamABCDE complex)